MALDEDDVKKVLVAGLSALAGAAILQSHHDKKRKGRAEKNDPAGTRWICELVWDLLDDWEPGEFDCEDDYTEDLFEFLNEAIEDELEEGDPEVINEMRRNTLHGVLDILIHNRLVLELKVTSRKSERDRLVGQCCEYSRGYVTWAIRCTGRMTALRNWRIFSKPKASTTSK